MDSIEIDFTPQIEACASLTTKCDDCGKVLGDGYARGKDNISLYLKNGKDEQGYDQSKNFDFCDEKCLCNFLNKRNNK